MNPRPLLLTAVAVCSILLGQDTAPTTRRSVSRPALVDVGGRVVDAKGIPIRNAHVSLAWGDLHKSLFFRLRRELPKAITDAEGAFNLRGVIPSDYYLLVQHEDFAWKESAFTAENDNFRHPDVVLRPGGRILGRVRVETDLPLGGAFVSISRKGTSMDWCGSRKDIVGKDGAFEFKGLPAGEYELFVIQRGNEEEQRKQFLEYLYSPGKRPIIKVRAGEVVTFNE